MKAYKLTPLAAVISTMAAGALSVSSIAQETKENIVNEEEIVVTGFRRSIINSIEAKRNADTIVEAISADDIGGLPDVSIADALARLPGITTERTGGQAGSIQIRGLSGEFVFSTLNGREQVSPNRGRTVEFNQYPAELLTQVAVYKSPKASLIEGGVAGTVELQTANPLDMSEANKFNVNLRGSYNDRAGDIIGGEETGSRFNISYQGKFLNDMLGLSAGYARLEQGSVDEFYSGSAWSSVNDADYIDLNGDGTRNAISDGFEFSHRAGNETRDGYLASLQFEPNEKLSVQADMYLSKFSSEQFQKGFLWQELTRFELDNLVIADNGVDVIGGQATIAPGTRQNGPGSHAGGIVAENQGFQTVSSDKGDEDETRSGGINITWTEDRWELSLDWSRSEAEGYHADGFARAHLYDNDPARRTPMHAYDENGLPIVATGSEPFTFELEEDGVTTTYVQAVDANSDPLWQYARADNITVSWLNQTGELPRLTTNQDFTNIDPNAGDFMRLSTYERYPHINSDEVDAFKIDGKIRFDDFFISSVELGARYSDRHYLRGRKTFVYDSFGGSITNNNLRSTSLELADSTTSIGTWSGQFSHFPAFLAIDSDAVFAQAMADGLVLNYDGTVRDATPRARWGEGRDWSMTQRADVTEEVLAYYVMANLDTNIMGAGLTGNIGVRVVETEQSAVGIRQADPLNGIEDAQIRDDLGLLPQDEGLAARAFFEDGDDYRKVLPSMNLNFSLTDQDQIRFAAAKVISRADIDDLANDTTIKLEQIANRQSYRVAYDGENNPFIRPFEANQIDLSYEHFFEDGDGYFAVAIYNKDILNRAQEIEIDPFNFRTNDFLNFSIPENITFAPTRNEFGFPEDTGGTFVVEDEGSLKLTRNNEEGGYIRGLELSYSQTFTSLPSPFNGLGMVANYSRVDSEITEPNPFSEAEGETVSLPGLAENSGSLTFYWEYEGFETRVSANYQDEKVGEVFDPTGGDGNLTIFEPQTTVAFQASYLMENGINILFQVNNLTDEPNKAFQGQEIKTDQIQYFGRQFFLGFNYTMDW